MSILKVDGFEGYQDLDASLTSAALPGTGYSLFSNGGTNPIRVAPGVAAESLAFQFARGGSYYSNMQLNFDSTADVVVVGFAFQGNTRAGIFALNGALTIGWDASGPLTLNSTVGPNVIVLARWYYLELVINKTAGTATLFVNDVEYLSIALPGALGTATSWSATFGWQSAGADGTARYDDLIVLDSADNGDGVTARLGPVEHRPITAQTTAQVDFDNPTLLTPVEIANNVPPQESVYLESATSGDRALFNRADFADDRAVLALTITGVLSKTDIDERQLGLVVVDGAGEQETVFDLGLTFSYRQAVLTADSQGAPWTPASINASNWGAVVRP